MRACECSAGEIFRDSFQDASKVAAALRGSSDDPPLDGIDHGSSEQKIRVTRC